MSKLVTLGGIRWLVWLIIQATEINGLTLAWILPWCPAMLRKKVWQAYITLTQTRTRITPLVDGLCGGYAHDSPLMIEYSTQIEQLVHGKVDSLRIPQSYCYVSLLQPLSKMLEHQSEFLRMRLSLSTIFTLYKLCTWSSYKYLFLIYWFKM